MAGQGQQIIITGANVLLYVNGRLFARVESFAWGDDTPSEEIMGIDVVVPIELAPTVIRVSGNMTLWRTKGDGGIEGPGIQPVQDQMPRGKYFSMMLIERVTDTVVFRADRCKVENQRWFAKPKSMVQGTVTWKAIMSSNEVGVSGRR